MKVLLENGADVNAVDKWKRSALFPAASAGHLDAVKVLIQNGADVNAFDAEEYTALHLAAEEGDVDIVKVLIQNGADVNAVGKISGTALQSSAHYGKVACTLQLLCFGAQINKYGCIVAFDDRTRLLRPIEERLNLLRSGKSMGTTLMSEEERLFMWHVAWFLYKKCPGATYKAFYAIRSFITFNGIFIVPGYRPPSGHR